MRNLLKVDFYRIFKSKTTLVALIVSIVMPLLMTGIIALEVLLIEGVDAASKDAVLSSTFNMIFQVNYQPFGDMGIVLIVFGSIFVMGDLNSGALRNKVIHGYKRSEIYFSHQISSLTFFVSLITISSLMQMLYGLLFFNYNPFGNADMVPYFLMFLLLGTLTFVMVSSLQIFLLLGFKNSPLSIIIPIALGAIFYIVTSVVSVFVEEGDAIRYVLDIIPTYALRMPNSVLSVGVLEIKDMAINAVATAGFSILNMLLGLLLFIKKDLK